jgi:hypothetical protein
MADALVEVAGEKLPLFDTYSEEAVAARELAGKGSALRRPRPSGGKPTKALSVADWVISSPATLKPAG